MEADRRRLVHAKFSAERGAVEVRALGAALRFAYAI
jgi:hypothetical protein